MCFRRETNLELHIGELGYVSRVAITLAYNLVRQIRQVPHPGVLGVMDVRISIGRPLARQLVGFLGILAVDLFRDPSPLVVLVFASAVKSQRSLSTIGAKVRTVSQSPLLWPRSPCWSHCVNVA